MSRFWKIALAVIVVVVIAGIFVVPRLGSHGGANGQADKAKVQTAQTQVRMLKGALETMRLDIGRFPTQEEGLELLVRKPADAALATRWSGPYLDGSVPEDPWGHPYQYSPKPTADQPVTLYSTGADGKPGGTDFDADVGFTPAP